ncbi:cell adhesion molecule CEACAM3 [Danio rerio]|uniref:Cell adhesion molecule CEACAM3 n=1 Tax=Danio rerio TaxID=7955 RepID=A0A8M1RN95_DANRE|nr:uncharacterized protein LOC100537432 [Danio rerio]|eukprot:XP_003201784.1 uncharacterized protein LOC100537432 [Danio rerio]
MTLKVTMKMVTLTVFASGVLCAGSDVVSVSVKKGDSVTLHNDFKITNQYKIRWYFKSTRIADIDLSNGKSCTDVQCNEGTEGFRDRLKLDHQTGNLTIMDIRNTDSGEYTLEVIISTGGDHEKIFSVTVYSVSAPAKQEVEKTPDSGLSAGAVAGICVAVLLVIGAAVAAVIYIHRHQPRRKGRAADINEQEPLQGNTSPE